MMKTMSKIPPSPTMMNGKLDTRVTISSSLWTLAADASSITTLLKVLKHTMYVIDAMTELYCFKPFS